METNRKEKLQSLVEEIRYDVDEKTAAKLELDKCNRIIERLASFENDCELCQEYLGKIEDQLITINEKKESLTKHDIKEHYKVTEEISSHLQKEHKLVPSGYYMGLYMSIGMSFGLLFGLLLFDNVAIGLPLGMVIGMAIGTGKDSEVKKKGSVI